MRLGLRGWKPPKKDETDAETHPRTHNHIPSQQPASIRATSSSEGGGFSFFFRFGAAGLILLDAIYMQEVAAVGGEERKPKPKPRNN